MPSPRVLDASLNRIERLPPSLPTSLQRLVLSSNRLSSLDGLEQLCNLKVRTGAEGCLLRLAVMCWQPSNGNACAGANNCSVAAQYAVQASRSCLMV